MKHRWVAELASFDAIDDPQDTMHLHTLRLGNRSQNTVSGQ
jgi:hypothetical protein